ncbi:Choline-sulfatase [Planctomycetes bacterium CA13]|uniref:Choline-sulfatase n=1 Tax=Novipirellula herctigrandis TaxID=2527986 RepID=A0A5C5ZCW9_9BACT|nr:Choline-sulfatase [Planctomycetes bacterium CA13]
MQSCYRRLFEINILVLCWLPVFAIVEASELFAERPNIVFILTDDHRWDCLAAGGNEIIATQNLDRICKSGTWFENAFVTLAICSPSRAACLTGRYGSANGVTSVGVVSLADGERTFSHALSEHGYATGVVGKWHLKSTPDECGFEFASTCWSNGPWYNRKFTIDGETKVMPGFVDDVAVEESIRFIDGAVKEHKPFMLWLCTQVPHMDQKHTWPADEKILAEYDAGQMPLPKTWNDDLDGKPEYLKTSRNRTQATKYGYDDATNIRNHMRDYYASVEQMDASVGRLLDELDRRQIRDKTWIILMGDNGWFLGEHGMTNKVLPYEESMRVPMAIAGPSTAAQISEKLVLNIDLTATIYELAGLSVPSSLHGCSLLPIVAGKSPIDWRRSFLYEAPTPQLGSEPLWAVRNGRWKYVETEVGADHVFHELYDLSTDRVELENVMDEPANQVIAERLVTELQSHKKRITAASPKPKSPSQAQPHAIPQNPPPIPRTDLFISGVYPQLTTYGIYSQNGAHYKSGHNECGIGAIVPWAGKLWMVNYAPHMPKGSEHKLFSVDPDLSKPMTVHSESVGGTPAGRMIHPESNQLLIAHYLIDASGKIRTISPNVMPMRVTAIARHLSDPQDMVYYIDMEGAIWEANVHTLAVKRLFKKPVPGWHSKGGYTSQGRLVISNNGELHVGDYNDVLVGGKAKNEEERGVLAEFDGTNWKIVERRQFTEVTGPSGITGGSDGDDPIWTMGWDRRSVRLKVLDDGTWHTFLLPKAAYCNDASHGWYTEWPRIREITDDRWMMDMHGMFFDFPKHFSANMSAGIKPIGSHLRYVPDFCSWNGRLVLASDETSIQGNKLAGQPQSNLWFGNYEDLKTWGPASGYGGPWIQDDVKTDQPSDPFLVAGFDRRVVHLAVGQKTPQAVKTLRTNDRFKITAMPNPLARLPRVTVARGDWHNPAAGFDFRVDSPVTVYLAVDQRGKPKLDPEWEPTDMTVMWHKTFRDQVYRREFPIGNVSIPGNDTEHTPGSYGMPHAAFVAADNTDIQIIPTAGAMVTWPISTPAMVESGSVTFTLEADQTGTGDWAEIAQVNVPADGNVTYFFPDDFDAVWVRFKTDRDCVATAFLHQTTSRFIDGKLPQNKELFAGLAEVGDKDVHEARIYAAKRNRNLRVITGDNRFLEFTKADFVFQTDKPDTDLASLLHVEPEFTVDEASVILESGDGVLRLPKGDSAFDKPFASMWPRTSREVESERHLANIHGTFYEVPLVTNGAPPAWNRMRPVSSHSKQITDFCTWNGLLVLAGVRSDAKNDGHVFADNLNSDQKADAALWFGSIDDLWKFGKPIGSGGPWRNTKVTAGVPSDPYLMTGYDEKSLELSHESPNPVTITVEVDIEGSGLWVPYRAFVVRQNEALRHDFPSGFSACWVRAISDSATSATMQLTYR